MGLADEVRALAARVAGSAGEVRIREDRVGPYADSLGTPAAYPAPFVTLDADDEARAALHLTLDAINFGSGWFPTLRKRNGKSGTYTIWTGVRDTFEAERAWTAADLRAMTPRRIARAAGQDPGHELMALYAEHLRELGERIGEGSFLDLARRPRLAEHLAGWPGFADPFRKRAQITAYDMVCAGLAEPGHEGDLTIFADNLVPHVLRLDGVLEYDPALVARIEAGELLAPGQPAEVEIRGCAVHAVELMLAARPRLTAPGVDGLLWHRGQLPRYKAVPRHRARTTAY